MNAKTTAYRIIDESDGGDKSRNTLTRVYLCAGRKVRVTVVKDFYASQSSAVAEVLSDLLTWTLLASAPASDWYDTRTTRRDVADQLAGRATTILTAT